MFIINILSLYFIEWVELEETYSLSAVSTLQEAVHTIIKFLGLGPANATDKVPEGTHTHTLVCSGKFLKKYYKLYFNKFIIF